MPFLLHIKKKKKNGGQVVIYNWYDNWIFIDISFSINQSSLFGMQQYVLNRNLMQVWYVPCKEIFSTQILTLILVLFLLNFFIDNKPLKRRQWMAPFVVVLAWSESYKCFLMNHMVAFYIRCKYIRRRRVNFLLPFSRNHNLSEFTSIFIQKIRKNRDRLMKIFYSS